MDKFQFDEFVWQLRDEAGMSAADAQQAAIGALVKDAGFGSICGDRDYGLFDLFKSAATPTWRPVIAGQEPKQRVLLSMASKSYQLMHKCTVVGEYVSKFEIECEDGGDCCYEDGTEYLISGWYADSFISDSWTLIDDEEWVIIGWQPLPDPVGAGNEQQ
jgi:hypothetical protein